MSQSIKRRLTKNDNKKTTQSEVFLWHFNDLLRFFVVLLLLKMLKGIIFICYWSVEKVFFLQKKNSLLSHCWLGAVKSYSFLEYSAFLFVAILLSLLLILYWSWMLKSRLKKSSSERWKNLGNFYYLFDFNGDRGVSRDRKKYYF